MMLAAATFCFGIIVGIYIVPTLDWLVFKIENAIERIRTGKKSKDSDG